MNYQAPVQDMAFLLEHVFGVTDALKDAEQFADQDMDLYTAILEEAGKFCSSVLLPLNRSGDEEGCRHEGDEVFTPKGFKEAYRQFVESGWQGISADPEYGGQGLPKALHVLVEEMVYATNTSFCLYPSLTAGAVHAIKAHASDELKQTYLEKLVTGEWSGTMCLTEAHAGSDLGLMKSKAEPNDDGSYTITGTKIFITGGEHDMADNIIHLVLAKLPDAPRGAKGISLFVVPKFLVNSDGSLGERNPIFCGSIEHKMGIKASSTCVMNLDGAKGFIVGNPHEGLRAMFTMMNNERLSIGIQGVGLGEMSYQLARNYAVERVQGRSGGKESVSIMQHADVRRMLLTQRGYNEAGRALAVMLGLKIDEAAQHPEPAVRKKAEDFLALLTPVAKAFFTDKGTDVCNLGVQVFGGHGYVREWGVEQLVRDARIAQIYEGTNGIQAQDLLVRKVVANGGSIYRQFSEWAAAELERASSADSNLIAAAQQAMRTLDEVTDELLKQSEENVFAAQGGAVEYLHLFGHALYAVLWCSMAANAPKTGDEQFAQRKQFGAQFFMEHLLPLIETYRKSIQHQYLSCYEAKEAVI